MCRARRRTAAPPCVLCLLRFQRQLRELLQPAAHAGSFILTPVIIQKNEGPVRKKFAQQGQRRIARQRAEEAGGPVHEEQVKLQLRGQRSQVIPLIRRTIELPGP